MVTVDDALSDLLPDCSDIVNVNTIHDAGTTESGDPVNATNSFLYINSAELSSSASFETVEYDGMTIELTSVILKNENTWTSVRIVIADAGVNDDIMDSAVFFKKNSFRSISLDNN